MPQGDKSSYTNRQMRKAEHIEEGYEERGVSKKEAERRAWATVNKQEGGGKKSGSARKSSSSRRQKGEGSRSTGSKRKTSASSSKGSKSRSRK